MRAPKSAPERPFINRETLNEIRRSVDWQKAFLALGLSRDEKASRTGDWWAKSPFNPQERTASFHMNGDPQGGGRWYCHATGQGGGVLDLVQALHPDLNIYEAGRWLVEHGCCPPPRIYDGGATPRRDSSPAPASVPEAEGASGEEKKEVLEPNRPIRQSLLPALREQGTHAVFRERGIGAETCAYLGCGILPETQRSSLRGRAVFQIRSVDDIEAVTPKPVILSHIGRAVTEAQEADGKWVHYGGFRKSLELYNLDQLRLDPEALDQVQATGRIILVEGCFDVAKCVEAGIKNVVASFGTAVSGPQIEKLHLLKEVLRADEILVWFDRDKAGVEGQRKALAIMATEGLKAHGFEWEIGFSSPRRGQVHLPDNLGDPADFNVDQLRWLREHSII